LITYRLPALHGIALAGLIGFAWLTNGSVSPTAPQTTANLAWRELWSASPDGLRSSIAMFRQALASDPAFPYRWSDLADALAAAGQVDAARYCFRRSLELAPGSPQIAMRAANFDLREGETGPALELGTTVLRIAPAYDSMVFNSWTRLGGNLHRILETGIGANPRAAESFFRFLIGIGDEARLSETWQWMEGRNYVNPSLARTWTAWLLARHQDRDAFGVWKRYVALDSAYGVTNWIDNSGFEVQPAGEGFAWRLQPGPGAKARLDPTVAHSGHSSLRLEFDGSENVDFHNVVQHVWLPPGRYRLSAWMRSADLSTDQGVALVVNGVSTPAPLGTHDWTEVGTDVTVPDTAVLEKSGAAGEVEVVRHPSWRFDGKPRGVVWIDDVELRRIGPVKRLPEDSVKIRPAGSGESEGHGPFSRYSKRENSGR